MPPSGVWVDEVRTVGETRLSPAGWSIVVDQFSPAGNLRRPLLEYLPHEHATVSR